MDHKADFHLLVQDKLGIERAKHIDWSNPTVYCIANNFNKYDLHAVNQMGKNILLVRYKLYDRLMLFERLNSTNIKTNNVSVDVVEKTSKNNSKTHEEKLITVPKSTIDLYDALCSYIESLGDDLIANQLKFYLAYKKTHNVACIEIYQKYILMHLN